MVWLPSLKDGTATCYWAGFSGASAPLDDCWKSALAATLPATKPLIDARNGG